MATYRLEAKILGRSGGSSAIAAAAYRSGSRLVDRFTGEVIDYTRRHGVVHDELLAPDGVPMFATREDLWNAVHDRERRSARWAGVAQLARELTLSLPHELSDEARVTLVRRFVRDQFVARGLVADLAIHRPDVRGDERNHHGHVMVTLRPLTADGFGRKAREFNTREQLRRWRESWAELVNEALERAQVDVRVDHRSLRDQGVAREPEPKQGPVATIIERSGRRSHAGDERRRVRTRNEEREARRRAERARHGPPLAQVISAALSAVSPLIAPVRDLVADLARNQQITITHPGHDRSREWQAQLLSRHYGQRILATDLGQFWNVQQTKRGIMFSRGKSQLHDVGRQISVTGDGTRDVKAVLDLAEQKGWNSIKIDSGTAAFRVAIMAAALQRGLDVVAKGDDAKILEQLRTMHAQRAQALDRTVPAAQREVEQQPAAAAADATERIVRESLKLLTQQQSTFTRRDMQKVLERFSATPEHLAALMVAAQSDPDIRVLGPDERGIERFSTGELLATEDRLLAQGIEMATARGFDVDERFREEIIQKKGLKPQQIVALKVTTAPNKLSQVIGLAGTGKSYVMGAVREVLEQAGYDVIGGALGGVATDSLAKEAGIKDARTIAAWCVYLERHTFTDKTVFIGDEWGMVGSVHGAAIQRALYDAGAKMIQIGDGLQLQPIDAGAPFRALSDRLPPGNVARLDDVRRQKVEWQREATKFFGNAQPRDALKLYEQNDRFVESKTLDDAKAAIVTAWSKIHLEQPEKSQLVLAYTRADVLDVNQRLRAVKREHGELTGPDVTYATSNGERTFAVNDAVFFTEPSKALGVRNGTRAIVTAVDPEAKTISLKVIDQEDRALTVKLEEYKALDYSDCSTTHRAQGKTVDFGHFLATSQRGMGMDLAYVAMSRHREDAHLYWSHDQFKGAGQVYRVLCRFQAKDYTLDYSIDGAAGGHGLGVPLQGPNGIAMRAIYQIRAELAQVIHTAAHLRDTVADVSREQAQKAYGAVTTWFNRVDTQLRDLESRGIRGVALQGTAQTFAERMALIEKSVDAAISRAVAMNREPAVAREVPRLLDREVAGKRLESIRATLRERLEQIAAELKTHVPAPPTVQLVIATELSRLERAVTSAASDAQRVAAQLALDAARARFASNDVLAGLRATYVEQSELHAIQEAKKKVLIPERRELDAWLQRVDAIEQRIARIDRGEFQIGYDVEGVELVEKLEQDVGTQPPSEHRVERDPEIER